MRFIQFRWNFLFLLCFCSLAENFFLFSAVLLLFLSFTRCGRNETRFLVYRSITDAAKDSTEIAIGFDAPEIEQLALEWKRSGWGYNHWNRWAFGPIFRFALPCFRMRLFSTRLTQIPYRMHVMDNEPAQKLTLDRVNGTRMNALVMMRNGNSKKGHLITPTEESECGEFRMKCWIQRST